jgi:hypothetical protein
MSLKINSKLSLGGGVVFSLGIILSLMGFYVCIKYFYFYCLVCTKYNDFMNIFMLCDFYLLNMLNLFSYIIGYGLYYKGPKPQIYPRSKAF